MHYVALVIGDDIDAIMDPYNEGKHTIEHTDEYGDTYPHNPVGFWDWFEVGGRWTNELILKDGTRTNSARRRDIETYAIDTGPFRVVTPEGTFARWERISGKYGEHPGHTERFWKVWNNLPPNVLVTIVDYHS